MISLIIDGVLAALLLGAIVMGALLHRKLSTLRTAQNELKSLIGGLNDAVAQAQQSIAALKSLTFEADELMSDKTKSARALADELALMTEAGENLAQRLDATVDQIRAEPSLKGRDPDIPTSAAEPIQAPQNREAETLLSALKGAR